jgi:hypothetical protein
MGSTVAVSRSKPWIMMHDNLRRTFGEAADIQCLHPAIGY